MKKMLKVLSLMTIVALPATSFASNLNFLLESLGTEGKISSKTNLCNYTVQKENSLNFKGLEEFPVYSISINTSEKIIYDSPNGGQRKVNEVKLLLINEPSLKIEQNYLGELQLALELDVLREKTSPQVVTQLKFLISADGKVLEMTGEEKTYEYKDLKTLRKFSCYNPR
jgi:hypothetical protein